MNNLTCTTCGADNGANARYCNRCGYALPQPTIETAEVPVKKKVASAGSQKTKLIGSIAGAVIFILASWGVRQVFFKQPSIDKVLMEAASEINKTLPIMVDQYTRLDNTIALPDKSLQYNYTLVELTAEEVNVDTIKKYMEPTIINTVRTSPDLKIYRENKVTMIYNYKDKNGVFVYKLSVTPDMYQ